jgi:hypothetical protein
MALVLLHSAPSGQVEGLGLFYIAFLINYLEVL